jgi:hypothetical protein
MGPEVAEDALDQGTWIGGGGWAHSAPMEAEGSSGPWQTPGHPLPGSQASVSAIETRRGPSRMEPDGTG